MLLADFWKIGDFDGRAALSSRLYRVATNAAFMRLQARLEADLEAGRTTEKGSSRSVV